MLTQGKLCSAKMLLAAYMPPLRITIKGKIPLITPSAEQFVYHQRLGTEQLRLRFSNR